MWVVVGVYLSVFINSYVFFTSPFEFQFGYLIYIILLPGFLRRHEVNRPLVNVFTVLFLTGIMNVILGYNTFSLFIKVYTGLLLSYFFYYYVIVEYDFDIERLFKWYLIGAYYAALLGVFQFVSFQIGYVQGYNFWDLPNKWSVAPGGLFGLRINSIFSEPTHLACVLAPAFFIAVYSLFIKRYHYSILQSCVIIAVYILSFSGLGQLAVLLTVILLAINLGFIRYVFLAIPVAMLTFNFMYNNVSDFRERLDSLVGLFSGREEFQLGKTHGSSFVLYNNYQVAKENFKTNFVFGTGIGSHAVAFSKYSRASYIKTFGFNLNSADANSMFLRLLSETGLFGVILVFALLVKCYVLLDPRVNMSYWLISNSILVMILLNLFRQGHYFLNGFPLFILMYVYNYVGYIREVKVYSSSMDSQRLKAIS